MAPTNASRERRAYPVIVEFMRIEYVQVTPPFYVPPSTAGVLLSPSANESDALIQVYCLMVYVLKMAVQ